MPHSKGGGKPWGRGLTGFLGFINKVVADPFSTTTLVEQNILCCRRKRNVETRIIFLVISQVSLFKGTYHVLPERPQ